MKQSTIILRLSSILSEMFSFKSIIFLFSCTKFGKVSIKFLKEFTENVDSNGIKS